MLSTMSARHYRRTRSTAFDSEKSPFIVSTAGAVYFARLSNADCRSSRFAFCNLDLRACHTLSRLLVGLYLFSQVLARWSTSIHTYTLSTRAFILAEDRKLSTEWRARLSCLFLPSRTLIVGLMSSAWKPHGILEMMRRRLVLLECSDALAPSLASNRRYLRLEKGMSDCYVILDPYVCYFRRFEDIKIERKGEMLRGGASYAF